MFNWETANIINMELCVTIYVIIYQKMFFFLWSLKDNKPFCIKQFS